MQHRQNLQEGSSRVIIIAFVLLLLAIVAGYFFMRGRSGTATSMMDTTSPTAAVSSAPAGPVEGSILDILGKGSSLECDIKVPAKEGQPSPFSTGKLWTTGTTGRSTLSGAVSGVAMEANAIYKDKTVYTWIITNGTKMGFKVSPEEAANANAKMTPQQMQQAEQYKQKMIFNCHAWTVDQSKFVLPTDVVFKDQSVPSAPSITIPAMMGR